MYHIIVTYRVKSVSLTLVSNHTEFIKFTNYILAKQTTACMLMLRLTKANVKASLESLESFSCLENSVSQINPYVWGCFTDGM